MINMLVKSFTSAKLKFGSLIHIEAQKLSLQVVCYLLGI